SSKTEQVIVGNAAPEEERQARCQFLITHRMRSPQLVSGAVVLHAIYKGCARQNPHQAGANTFIERFAVLASLLVEIQRRLDIGSRHCAAIGAPSQFIEDARRTTRFVAGGCTDEDPVARRRRAYPCYVVRPFNGGSADLRHAPDHM